jgi:hypothetical protein
MKKLFTSTFLLAAAALAPVSGALAADLTVGPGGTYASIGAAITASADGDRILVKPKAIPYGETLTITKSLTIASADEGTFFTCTGDWTFTPASAQKRLIIIGMRNIAGDIKAVGAATGTGRSSIQILGSVVKGDINFNHDNYYVTVAADSVQGSVFLRAGRVIGNYVDGRNEAQVIYTTSEGLTPANDSIWVVGNHIIGNNTNSNQAVELTTAQHYIYCSNNYLVINPLNNHYNYGFYLNAQRAPVASGGVNTLSNNTVFDVATSNTRFGIGRHAFYLQSPLNNTAVVGNLVVSAQDGLGTGTNGNGANVFQQNGGVSNFTFAYNIVRGYTFGVTVPNNGTNKTTSTATVTPKV